MLYRLYGRLCLIIRVESKRERLRLSGIKLRPAIGNSCGRCRNHWRAVYAECRERPSGSRST